MPKYVIERDIPNAGSLTAEQLQAIAKKAGEVTNAMDAKLQWLESYVTDDKLYCVYIAPNEDAIREQGEKGGFPVTRISQIRSIIDPSIAE